MDAALNFPGKIVCIENGILQPSATCAALRCVNQGTEIDTLARTLDKRLSNESLPAHLRVQDIALGEQVLKRCQRSSCDQKAIAHLDRILGKHREGYRVKGNADALAKWTKYGQPEGIFRRHPNFCSYLERTLLLSQLRITRDAVSEVNGEPGLTVDGAFMPFSRLKETFELKASKSYPGPFLVHRMTRQVYSYLDNGLGLQSHHPYLSERPIAKLNDADYERTLAKARTFIRPEEANLSAEERQARNQDREFIVQIVSHYIPGGESNLSRTLDRPRHTVIRVICGKDNPMFGTKKGDVFEVGYGWKVKKCLPLWNAQGMFRTPDSYNFKPSTERVVTNVAVTQEEARATYLYTLKYHRDAVNVGQDMAYHLSTNNCTVYVRQALRQAGIQVPTEIAVHHVIGRIAPNWIQAIGKAMCATTGCVGKGFSCLPKRVKNAASQSFGAITYVGAECLKGLGALCLVPLRAMGGEVLGEGGHAFADRPEQSVELERPLRNWKSWFSPSHYRINLPITVIEWQKQQPSTVIYKNAIQMSIVPPNA